MLNQFDNIILSNNELFERREIYEEFVSELSDIYKKFSTNKNKNFSYEYNILLKKEVVKFCKCKEPTIFYNSGVEDNKYYKWLVCLECDSFTDKKFIKRLNLEYF